MRNYPELDSLKIIVLAEDSVLYESPFLGQHGISLLLEARKGNIKENILMDVGQSSNAILSNMEKMGVSPQIIDTIVLTHCHYDHTQGVVDIINATAKNSVQIIVHPDIFRIHFITAPFLRFIGITHKDSKDKIEEAGGILYLTKDPLTLMPGLLTTGEVKRLTDFEDPGIALSTIENGKVKKDHVLDDISIIANVKGKGLVIITGCSHAGIVNIVKHSIDLTKIDNIEGIIGGFHLIEADNTKIEKTVAELSKLNINWIKAGHCTGFKAQVELYSQFQDRFQPLHTGMVIEI